MNTPTMRTTCGAAVLVLLTPPVLAGGGGDYHHADEGAAWFWVLLFVLVLVFVLAAVTGLYHYGDARHLTHYGYYEVFDANTKLVKRVQYTDQTLETDTYDDGGGGSGHHHHHHHHRHDGGGVFVAAVPDTRAAVTAQPYFYGSRGGDGRSKPTIQSAPAIGRALKLDYNIG